MPTNPFALNPAIRQPASDNRVPNEIPTRDDRLPIAVIGEAPGADEAAIGRPFVGPSGNVLRQALAKANLPPERCFIGNLCQYRPKGNDFKTLPPDLLAEGRKQLAADLKAYNPSLILLCGNQPLRASGKTLTLNNLRGGPFDCHSSTSPFFNFRCFPTYHPAAILRQWHLLPVFCADIRKAARIGLDPTWTEPTLRLDISLSAHEVIQRMNRIPAGSVIAVDIEGGTRGMPCLSIATTINSAFALVFRSYSPTDEGLVMQAFARLMSRPDVGKVFQNGIYDTFVLAYTYNIPVSNFHWDTMFSGWELQPDLPKSLEMQTSLYTDIPPYKFEGKVQDATTQLNYCCKDSIVTLRLYHSHKRLLASSPLSLSHLSLNHQLLAPTLFMQLKGIRYDTEACAEVSADLASRAAKKLARLRLAANDPQFNANSPKQVADLLYKKLSLPVQKSKTTGRDTTGIDACLELLVKHPHQAVQDLLHFRRYDKRRQIALAVPDPDGRMRGSYNLVGTNTGRLSCSESTTGNGTNLQTIPYALRHLYRADPDHYFFQCDLKGADGWTVAAGCKAYDDPVMWDDYMFGLKPAKIIALLYTHGPQVNSWTREQLKEASEDVKEDWLYKASKAVQHGANYGVGGRTTSDIIRKRSYTETDEVIDVPPKECLKLRRLYMETRYVGVLRWQESIKQQIQSTGQLTAASGTTKTFFARRNDHSTFREAWSFLPQANTTYATNLALQRLWYDRENRDPSTNLPIIQPLHQVHDAICGQFPISRLDWAIDKIRSYFDNPITLYNESIAIPFDGGYGPSWGELDNFPPANSA